ncbi:hypothetical protein [Natrarchaeobaculum aegyptiacum]|nr:hypothetical protein [Natrarchaeobaculum aegyptiacum]
MATRERTAGEYDCEPATTRRLESIPPGATVRHVDQLSPAELEAFLARLDGDGSADDPLEAGSVVVFTDNVRLE